MTVFVWILQVLLAVLYVGGGVFKTFMSDQLVAHFAGVPRAVWGTLGVVEMVGGVLLIVPAAMKWMPALTPLAAAVLAVETLALAVLYSRYSIALSVENAMVWALGMGIVAAFVAYSTHGRYA